jgi:MFS family permease
MAEKAPYTPDLECVMEKRPGEPATRSLLKNHAFLRLLMAQFCALTVVYGLSLAGIVLVEERTQSSAQTGLVLVSSILPAFLASLISGAVVDRWGRRRVLIVSHAMRVAVALAFWAATRFLPIGPALLVVYAVNFAGATFSQFAMPAELAMLPDLVGDEELVPANAGLQLGTLAAEGLGIIVLSPLVIKRYGVPALGLVGAGLCLLAVILAASLPRDARGEASPARSAPGWAALGADLKAGWRVMVEDRYLLLIAIQATLAATLLLVLVSLLPGLVGRHLGLNVKDAPLLLLPGGLGFLLGSFLIGRWERRLSRQAWVGLGFVGLGLSTGLLALARDLWLSVPCVLGIGLTLAAIAITARAVLQERPPAAVRGRVIAAQLALANASAVLPLWLGGSLADRWGIQPVMAGLGTLALLLGVGSLAKK